MTETTTSADGTALAYGHSSGAILTLEALIHGAAMTAVAVYEPPYRPFGAGANPMEGVQEALDAGDDSLAALTFVKGTGMEDTDDLTSSPWWPSMVAVAPTLTYDLALTGDGVVPAERLAGVSVPVLAIDGGLSPDWAAEAALAIEASVRSSRRVTLAGQHHGVEPAVLAPLLVDFFG